MTTVTVISSSAETEPFLARQISCENEWSVPCWCIKVDHLLITYWNLCETFHYVLACRLAKPLLSLNVQTTYIEKWSRCASETAVISVCNTTYSRERHFHLHRRADDRQKSNTIDSSYRWADRSAVVFTLADRWLVSPTDVADDRAV